MAAPFLAAAAPAIISGLGSLFGGRAKRKAQEREEQARYQENMRLWTQKVANTRKKRSIMAGLAKTYGADSLLPPGFLDEYQNYNPTAPTRPGKVKGGGLAGFLGDVLPGIGKAMSTPRSPGELAGVGVGGGGGDAITQGLGAFFGSKTSPGMPTGSSPSPFGGSTDLGGIDLGAGADPLAFLRR